MRDEAPVPGGYDPRARATRARFRLYIVTLAWDEGREGAARLYAARDADEACERALAVLAPAGAWVRRVRRLAGNRD